MSNENLVYDGVCPVCGEEFEDGMNDFDEGETYRDVWVCIIEKPEDGDEGGSMLIHREEPKDGGEP